MPIRHVAATPTSGVNPASGLRGRSLRREDATVDDDVTGRQMDVGHVRAEDRDVVVVDRAAGHRGEVVRAVDRGSVVDVVGAGDEDGPDACVDEALQLGGDALRRTAGLDVRIEQVARDQEQVHLLDEREVDGSRERRELALALRGRLLAHVVVARTEVHVCGMDDP